MFRLFVQMCIVYSLLYNVMNINNPYIKLFFVVVMKQKF